MSEDENDPIVDAVRVLAEGVSDAAHRQRILAAINGDTVPAPTLPEGVWTCARCGCSPSEHGRDTSTCVLEPILVAATSVPDELPEWVMRDAVNEAIVALAKHDERWWRTDQSGRYYIGPTIAGDGSVDWPESTAPTLPDDFPSWVSMHATATGADLIEHDPNGEEWERWWANEWWTDHAAAADRRSTYLVRRRPVPVEPTTEKVPLHKVHGRTLAGYSWKVGLIGMDADGMVTVLREDGAS